MPARIPQDFGYTGDHDLLRKTARRFLTEKCPRSELRRLVDDEVGYDQALFSQQANMGWVGLPLPEDCGGSGLGYLPTALLFEELGRALCPTPLFSSLLAAIALERAGDEAQKKRWLPSLAAGEVLASVALTEPDASWEPESVHARGERTADGYTLHGEKTHVLFGTRAGLLVAPFSLDDTRALFAIELPCRGVRIEPETSVDPTRRTARVTFDRASVPAQSLLGGGGRSALHETHVRGFVLLAAEMVGAAESALLMTRDYANERVQFGRPIGAFQAVKHPIVNVMIAVESARSLVYAAAAALDAGAGDAEVLARMAKASAGDALSFAADRAVQLHGGFGFTWDCDAHFFFKRALWSAATLGDPRHHRRHLAERLRDLGADRDGR